METGAVVRTHPVPYGLPHGTIDLCLRGSAVCGVYEGLWYVGCMRGSVVCGVYDMWYVGCMRVCGMWGV